MIEVTAETEIDAAPETVWSVLTDFSHFAAWNPFIRNARGTATVGDEVRVRVRPSLGVPLVFHANVLYSEKDRALRWRGHVLASWIATGDHIFSIEPLGDGHVRFVQREQFHGIVPWLASKLLAREAKRGFEVMNAALKARAEAEERFA